MKKSYLYRVRYKPCMYIILFGWDNLTVKVINYSLSSDVKYPESTYIFSFPSNVNCHHISGTLQYFPTRRFRSTSPNGIDRLPSTDIYLLPNIRTAGLLLPKDPLYSYKKRLSNVSVPGLPSPPNLQPLLPPHFLLLVPNGTVQLTRFQYLLQLISIKVTVTSHGTSLYPFSR